MGTFLGRLKGPSQRKTQQESGPARNVTPFHLSLGPSFLLLSPLFSLWGYTNTDTHHTYTLQWSDCPPSLGSGLIEWRDHILAFAQPGSFYALQWSALAPPAPAWLWAPWKERPYSNICPAWFLALEVTVSYWMRTWMDRRSNEWAFRATKWKRLELQWLGASRKASALSFVCFSGCFTLGFWNLFTLKWIYCYCILQQVRFGMLPYFLWWVQDFKIERLEFQKPQRSTLTATLDCFPFIKYWLWKSQVIFKPKFPKSGSEFLKHT